jgi:hypothetical protein
MMRSLLALLLCLFLADFTMGVPAMAQDAGEVAVWDSVRDSKNPAELPAYIDAYPDGTFVPLARLRVMAMGGAPAPAAAEPPKTSEADKGAAKPAATKKAAKSATAPKKGPQVATAKPVYGPFEPITVTWSGLPASLTNGWIAVYKRGETQEAVRNGATFTPAKPGSIELAGMLPGDYDLVLLTPPYGKEYKMARNSFTVAAPGTEGAGEPIALTPASDTVMPFEPMELHWGKLPASLASGWVRMSKADGTEVTRQSFDGRGGGGGAVTFEGTLPGTYKFDLLAPPYGAETVMASAEITVTDPNAEEAATVEDAPETPAEEAPAEEPTDAPAQAEGGETAADTGAQAEAPEAAGQATAGETAADGAAAGGVAHSTLGGIAFAEPPKPADPNLGPMLLGALKGQVDVACTGPTEAYVWKVGANDDKRMAKLLTDAVLALKGNGYGVTQVKSDLNNTLFYRAAGADKLLMIWLYDEATEGLHLVLCPGQ